MKCRIDKHWRELTFLQADLHHGHHVHLLLQLHQHLHPVPPPAVIQENRHNHHYLPRAHLRGLHSVLLLDEDMTTLDMTKNIAYMHICQVISSANYSIIYLCYPEQKYFTHFCVLSNCRCMGHLYNPHMKIRKKEMFICCPKSSLTSLLAQEKIESKSLTFWIQIRTAQTHLTQNAHKFFIRTPNWVILFLLETRFRALSNPIGITFKFVRSVELWTKQSDAAAESESNYKSKGVTSPPLGPIGLVRPRFSFRLPWDVLPPPWPPPLAPI